MIIFLYGPDSYRSRQKLNEIVEHYKKIHQSGLNLKYFEGKKIIYQDFKDEIQQAPMFKEKKIVVLNDIFLNSDFREKFLRDKKNFVGSKEIILFYESSQIAKNDSLFKFLIKQAESQEFKLLEGERLGKWIKKEFDNSQVEIEPDALNKLIDWVGNNLWQMSNEIKKLVSYKKGQKIGLNDIELLVRPKIEPDIFKTIDAIASKNKKQALGLIHQHLEKGDNPLYLFSMINFQFRNLLIIRSLIEKKEPLYSFSKKLNLHPYIIKKSYPQAQKFKIDELKKIYQKIFQIDLNIKIGKVGPETALDLLISSI
jgi:DNA polymerase-3 subunit delta